MGRLCRGDPEGSAFGSHGWVSAWADGSRGLQLLERLEMEVDWGWLLELDELLYWAVFGRVSRCTPGIPMNGTRFEHALLGKFAEGVGCVVCTSCQTARLVRPNLLLVVEAGRSVDDRKLGNRAEIYPFGPFGWPPSNIGFIAVDYGADAFGPVQERFW